MVNVKDMVEELVAKHYNNIEIQNILKSRSIDVDTNFVTKVRDDMYAPNSWSYNDPRWDSL
jgi:hypothetical protein